MFNTIGASEYRPVTIQLCPFFINTFSHDFLDQGMRQRLEIIKFLFEEGILYHAEDYMLE